MTAYTVIHTRLFNYKSRIERSTTLSIKDSMNVSISIYERTSLSFIMLSQPPAAACALEPGLHGSSVHAESIHQNMTDLNARSDMLCHGHASYQTLPQHAYTPETDNHSNPSQPYVTAYRLILRDMPVKTSISASATHVPGL